MILNRKICYTSVLLKFTHRWLRHTLTILGHLSSDILPLGPQLVKREKKCGHPLLTHTHVKKSRRKEGQVSCVHWEETPLNREKTAGWKWKWRKTIQLWSLLGRRKGVPEAAPLHREGGRGTSQSCWIPEASSTLCSHHFAQLVTQLCSVYSFFPGWCLQVGTLGVNPASISVLYSRAGAETKISLHLLVPYPPAYRVLCTHPSSPFSSSHLLFKESGSNGFTLSQDLNKFLMYH